MRSDVSLGWVKVRLELIPIMASLAVVSGVEAGLALLLAIIVHEAGHFAAARLVAGRGPALVLQMTGGGSYVRDISSVGQRAIILASGPLAGVVFVGLAIGAGALVRDDAVPFVRELAHAGLVWTVFQVSPFPPLDGGQALQLLLVPRICGATTAWRIGWALGLVGAALVVLIDQEWLQTVVLLTGMALVLGRAESGYVRHLDAYAAWRRGDHLRVLKLVRKAPDYLDKNDRVMLLELGLFSAMEMKDPSAIEELAPELPPCRPVVLAAAEWLLGAGRDPSGPKLAQRALDAVDAQVIEPSPEARERLADLAFRFAIHEVRQRRLDSALGLLEKAIDLGFGDADRVRADGDLRGLEGHPRWPGLLARLEANAPPAGD